MSDKVSNYQAIKRSDQISSAAGIQASVEGRRKIFITKTLDLSTAKDQFSPEKVEFNFRSFWVVSATDSTAAVSLVPNTQAEGQLNDVIPLKQNLALRLPFPSSGGQLYWSAQSGKTMVILFFIDAEVTPGSQITQISGGVQIGNGSSRSDAALKSTQDQSSVAIAITPTMIVPADSLRIGAEFEVNGGQIKIGGSGISATKGVTRNDSERWEDSNTGALYAIAVSGNPVVTGIIYK